MKFWVVQLRLDRVILVDDERTKKKIKTYNTNENSVLVLLLQLQIAENELHWQKKNESPPNDCLAETTNLRNLWAGALDEILSSFVLLT